MISIHAYFEHTVLQDGLLTTTGEDAFPVSSPAGLFAADGIGGSAGIAVVGLPEDVFSREGILQAYQPMTDESWSGLPPEQKKELDRYLVQNYQGLIQTDQKKIYTENRNIHRKKASGYFGSHALGTVLCADLLSLEGELQGCSHDAWRRKVRKILQELPSQYHQAVHALSPRIGVSAGGLKKIRYYGTTLTAIFTRETADTVEAVTASCGDSRAAAWDSDAFYQAADDQSSDAGGITACFYDTLRGPGEVQIAVTERTFPKPCILCCMTDGVFSMFHGNAGFASSPLHLDGTFMKILSSSDSREEAKAKLEGMMRARCTTDDSASLSLAAFGFPDYDALRAFAAERMAGLTRRYHLERMPDDFLVSDYVRKAEELEQDVSSGMQPLLEEALGVPAVRSAAEDLLHQPEHFSRYGGEIRKAEDRIHALQKSCRDIRQRLTLTAGENCLDFRPVQDGDGSGIFRPGRIWSQKREMEAGELGKQIHALQKRISRLLTDYRSRILTPQDLLDGVDAVLAGNPGRNRLERAGRALESELWCLQEAEESLRKEDDLVRKWYETNKKIAQSAEDFSAEDLADAWLHDGALSDHLAGTTIPRVRGQILELVHSFAKQTLELEKEKEKRREAEEAAQRQCFLEQGSGVLFSLLDTGVLDGAPSLKEKIRAQLSSDARLCETVKICACQKKTFELVMKEYTRILSPECTRRMQKNGWL